MIYIGVDPGQTGALVAVNSDGAIVGVLDMPISGTKPKFVFGAAIRDWLFDLPPLAPKTAWVEKVGAMPRQGASSTFNFGAVFGGVVSILGVLSVPVDFVTPGSWKKAAGLTGQDKDASRRLALQYWPDHGEAFARKKDVDRAEAALIARYGRMHGPA